MTPDETSPVPVNEHLLAQMMACDALLHADPRRRRIATRTVPTPPRRPTTWRGAGSCSC